jgi:putative ABC transport system permease protein
LVESKQPYQPPKWPERLLRLVCKDDLLEEIEGDLFEHYQALRTRHSKLVSSLVYWFHAFNFLRPFALKKVGQHSNHLIMYSSYFKFATRSMWRHKASTAFNLVGLVLAFTVCGLIYLHVKQELSFDKFHERSADIYRVAWMNDNPQTRTPHPMAQAMVSDIPEVESAVSLTPIYGPGLTKVTIPITLEKSNITFEEPNGFFADSAFFDVFDVKFIEGNPATALEVVNGVVLSKSMADRYFFNEKAVGNRLSFGPSTEMLEVVGVVEDFPLESHFHFNFLISYMTLKSMPFNDPWLSWDDFGHFNYVKLKEGVSGQDVEAKIPDFAIKYLNWPEEGLAGLRQGVVKFALQPITDIHLKSNIRWELETNSSMTYLVIYSVSGLFILLISIINFVNLSTARSAQRLKEVGVKKTLGAKKSELLTQFVFESILMAYSALVLSLLAIRGLENQFNQLVSGHIHTEMIFSLQSLSFLFVITTITAILAAAYPSIYLNALKPGDILKGSGGKKISGAKVRMALLGVQFIAAVIMIAGSLIISDQISFIKNKDLGFSADNLVMIDIDNWEDRSEIVKNRFRQIAGVKEVSTISNPPGGNFNQHSLYAESDPTRTVDALEIFVDKEVLEVLDMELVDGRFIDVKLEADSAGRSFVMNETAIKELGFDSGVGENIGWNFNENLIKGQIVGVVKDFHYQSLHTPIRPLIMTIRTQTYNNLLVKLEGESMVASLADMEKAYAELYPDVEFHYSFLDQQISDLYQEESRTLLLTTLLSAISIFLSIAGLIGIVLIAIKQRVKEIGIRKVLGASMTQILMLVNARFLWIGLIATMIAVPITFSLMQNWMGNFTYQNGINPLTFVLTTVGLLGLIFATISLISIKTARTNPAQSLRTE